MRTKTTHGRFVRYARIIVLALSLATGLHTTVHATDAAFALVPEMERPEGIEAQPAAVRAALAAEPQLREGLDSFRDRVRLMWPTLRDIDLVDLSRYHVEATRGYRLPAVPGALDGRIIGMDADGAHGFLELRGPRLPASFDIVHRHLVFYARFNTSTGAIDRVSVTIRLEVFE